MSYPPPYPGGYGSQPGYGAPQPMGFSFPEQEGSIPNPACPYPTNPSHPSGYPSQAAYPPYPGSLGQTPAQYPSYPGNPSQAPAQYPSYPSNPSQAPTQYSSYPSNPGQAPASYAPYPNTTGQLGQGPSAFAPYPGSEAYPKAPPPGARHVLPSLNQPPNAGYPVLDDFHSYNQQGSKQSPARPPQPERRMEEQGVPTVVPYGGFNATADAEALRKAMKGFGTDEKAIIQVLSRRTASQRMDILRTYKASFGKDLIKDLKSELSGNFERAILALMHPRTEYLATEVKEAIKGIGTEEGTLVEILATSTNREIAEMNQAYYRLYGKSMEDDIASDTSGDFKKLLVALCQGYRDENPVVDLQLAKNDAHKLYSAGAGRLGTEEAAFIQILATRSFPHIRQLQAEYTNITGHSLEDAVKSEFSGNVENGLVAILVCARSPAEYFATRIHKSLAGAGTRDRALMRCVVTRCEIDLKTVKDYYTRMYGRSLTDDIANDTSGDYKKLLIALCGHH